VKGLQSARPAEALAFHGASASAAHATAQRKGSELRTAAPFSIEIHDGYLYPPKTRERNATELAAEPRLDRPQSGSRAASGFDQHSQAMEALVGEELTDRAVEYRRFPFLFFDGFSEGGQMPP
jgi:hypothetical protein